MQVFFLQSPPPTPETHHDDLTGLCNLQDRPDLIISELSGLAFDSLQQAFRPDDLDVMFNQEPPEPRNSEAIYIAIDPAAGGPSSDYALVSMTRHKGIVTVSLRVSHHHHQLHMYSNLRFSIMVAVVHLSLRIQLWMHVSSKSWKNLDAL